MEKQTEYIGHEYITKLLNINNNVYHTEANKQLFDNKFPDGWLLNGDNLLIIEYKANSKDTKQGLTQLFRYCRQVVSKDENKNINIYCFLGIGTNENIFEKYFMFYNGDKLKRISENYIKNIFCNIQPNGISCQTIHNMIVDNYKFEKAEDLHDILLIIMSSIFDEDFRKYYEIKDKVIDIDFINDLIKLIETKISDSSVNYKHIIEALRKTPFKNSFNICKLIYEQYKINPLFVSSLFQQFKKYNKYIGSNNEIWTPPTIAKFMCYIVMKYNKNIKTLTLLDPCVGFNQLINPFITYCEQYNINLIVKGCEISSRTYFMGKIDLLNKGISNVSTYHGDFIKVNNDLLLSDCSINNPPYTMNISNKHDCLDFVMKTCDCCSNVVVNIFPKARLIKNKKLNKEFIQNYKLIEVIEIGNNIFKKVSTGDIVIIVASKLTDNNKDIKTKYYNLKHFSDEYKTIPHHEENVLTDKGKQIINDYLNNKTEYIEYIPTVDNMVPKQEVNIDCIKTNLLEQYYKAITYNNSLPLTPQKYQNQINETLLIDIGRIQNSKTLRELMNIIINNNDNNDYKLVKLLDCFQVVKFKTVNINDNKQGLYPLFSASMYGEPSGYIDNYTIDTNGEDYIRLNKNGSAGYCFICNGRFNMTAGCYLLKPIQKINLDINIKLLTLQLSNMGFGFSNPINIDKLNNIEVYMLFDDKNKNQNKYIKFKLSDRFQLVNKRVNYKYSTTGDNTGDIPLFACKKLDNGIAKYVDKEEYEGDVITVVHHRDATCGYSFHYTGKLAWNGSVYVIEPKEEYKNKLNLDYIAKYITLVISPNHAESESFTKQQLMEFMIEYPQNENT